MSIQTVEEAARLWLDDHQGASGAREMAALLEEIAALHVTLSNVRASRRATQLELGKALNKLSASTVDLRDSIEADLRGRFGREAIALTELLGYRVEEY